MRRIRILVSDLPGMLRDIVSRVLRSQQDMEIVDGSPLRADLPRVLPETPADVVILRCDQSELPETGRRLFPLNPGLTLLAIEDDGRRSFLYRLRPQTEELGEVSPQLLVEAIRRAARPLPAAVPEPGELPT